MVTIKSKKEIEYMREACKVTIENPNNGFTTSFNVTDNSSTQISTAESPSGAKNLQKNDCYSKTNETAT